MPGIRPFSLPHLQIGTDLCSMPRIRRIIAKESLATGPEYSKRLDGFLRRLFVPVERFAFRKRFPDVQAGGRAEEGEMGRVTAFLAGRWAAKEAVVKASSKQRLTFDRIVILQEKTSPRPYAIILDEAFGGSSIDGLTLDPGQFKNESEKVEDELLLEKVSPEDVLSRLDGSYARISISHDGDYATAVCLATDDE